MVITYKGRNIDLTNAEFGILSYMIAKQGLVVSREDLIHNVNAINEDSSNKSIDVMVGRIRNKLGDKTLIESVRGVGFCLSCIAKDIEESAILNFMIEELQNK